MDIELGESHRRIISSGMLIVDAAAVRMLDLLEKRNSRPALNVIEGSVPDGERQEIEASLLRLQEMIAAFVRKYRLEPSRRNMRRILAADTSQIWLCLEDSRPARITGYGRLPRSSAESLEADLQDMLRIANRLRGLLNS